MALVTTPTALELLDDAVKRHALASKLAKQAKDMQEAARSDILKLLEGAGRARFYFKGGHTWEYTSSEGHTVTVTIPYAAAQERTIRPESLDAAFEQAKRWGVEDDLFETTHTFLPEKFKLFLRDDSTDKLTRAEVGEALAPFLDEGTPSRALTPRVASTIKGG